MAMNLYLLEEFLEKVHIDNSTLKMWEKSQLLQPVAYTDDKIPLYSEKSAEEINHIRRLLDMGYKLDDIQKIIKKIGVPQSIRGKEKEGKVGTFLTVGNLAEQVGVSTRTIKHWEDKGIIEPDTRSEGGFRLYSEIYIYLCNLIKDLQLFGYTLEEIKTISDHFRTFVDLKENFESYPLNQTAVKIQTLLNELEKLFDKVASLKEGIQRWEDLLKKKRKELNNLQNQNQKRIEKSQEKKDQKKSSKK